MDPGKSADGRKMYFRTLDDSMRAAKWQIGIVLRASYALKQKP